MALVAIARSGCGRSEAAALTQVRLGRVERRLLEMASYVGLPPEAVPPPVAAPVSTVGSPSQAVLDLAAAGQKIQAIKLYRTETGAGLKDAKDAVESAAEAAEGTRSEFKINA